MRIPGKMLMIFSILVWGLSGSITMSFAGPRPVITEFSAEPISIIAGKSSLLTWTTRKADTCVLSPGKLSVPCNGSMVVWPTATTDYNLMAFNSTALTGVTITVTVDQASHPPVANDDSAATEEDVPVTVNLLDNDTDADGDSLTIESISPPANGIAVQDGYGSVTYTPNENFNGSDGFGYSINDGNGGTDTAAVSITVTPVNDPPTAHAQSLHTVEGTPLSLTLTASDMENDPLMYSVITSPGYGSLSGSPPSLIYQPGPEYQSADSFSFKANDGEFDSNTATISITISKVNHPPVANDDSAVTDEDSLAILDVLGNDADEDGNAITVVSVGQPANGTVIDNGDGTLTYSPNENFNGSDNFSYTINDGNGGSSTATVFIAVNPVNDPPVAIDTSVSTEMNTPVDVMLEASDIDNDPLNYIISDNPLNGTVSGADGDNTVTYTPNSDFSGHEIISFMASDGTAQSNTATVTIAVGVNDPPTAEPQNVTTLEDTSVSILLKGADPNNDSLTYKILSDPENGQLAGTPPDLTYMPNKDFNGSDTFSFVVNDGSLTSNLATVAITVDSVNDPPTAQNDLAPTIGAPPITTGDVLANDTDVDGDILTIVSFTQAENGTVVASGDNTFIYTPQYLYNGLDSFDYTITDGNGKTATGKVVLTVNNPPPTVTISSSPDRIVAGETSLLTWNSTYGVSAFIDNGVGEVPASGSVEAAPQEDTTYTVSVSGLGGAVSASTPVYVWSGKGRPSPSVSISAEPEVVRLNSPATLTWSSSKAVSLTIDNGIGAVPSEGSREVYPDADTTYTIAATDRKGNTAKDSVTIQVTPLNFEVYSPNDGEFLARPDVLVKGLSSNIYGTETGVKVNGECALTDGSEFTANHVQLTEGDNIITVSTTDLLGNSLEKSISVSASPGDFVTMAADSESGVAPFQTTLKLQGTFDFAAEPVITYDGPGSVNIQPGEDENNYDILIESPGLYYLSAEAANDQGEIFTDSMALLVMDQNELDSRLRTKWDGMKERLAARNIDGALEFFLDSSRERYRSIFSLLYDDLSQVVSEMQDIEMVYIKGNRARYRINNVQDINGSPVTITYDIYFTRDRDCIWKIKQF